MADGEAPDQNTWKRMLWKASKTLAGIGVAIIVVLGLLLAVPSWLNWRAERDAKAFCESLPKGSAVAPAIVKFENTSGKQEFMHFEFAEGHGHTFVFPGFVFDKAYCDVKLDDKGIVVSGRAYFQND